MATSLILLPFKIIQMRLNETPQYLGLNFCDDLGFGQSEETRCENITPLLSVFRSLFMTIWMFCNFPSILLCPVASEGIALVAVIVSSAALRGCVHSQFGFQLV